MTYAEQLAQLTVKSDKLRQDLTDAVDGLKAAINEIHSRREYSQPKAELNNDSSGFKLPSV